MVRPTRPKATTARREGGAPHPLLLAAAAVVALTLLHDLDHVRQGRQLPGILNLIGAIGTSGSLVVLVWVARGKALAAQGAALFGVLTALGLIAVHVVPRWSVVSDPYPEAQVDVWSWIGLVALITAGLALAAISWGRVRSK